MRHAIVVIAHYAAGDTAKKVLAVSKYSKYFK